MLLSVKKVTVAKLSASSFVPLHESLNARFPPSSPLPRPPKRGQLKREIIQSRMIN